MWNIVLNNPVSVVLCSILRLCALFTFEKGKIKISNVSLMYCHCHFVLSAKRFFCIEIFNWDLEKVSAARRCPLRTVRNIKVSFYETNPFLKSVRYRGCPL